jgi:transcriptional regulator with XRE-family HTH domain
LLSGCILSRMAHTNHRPRLIGPMSRRLRAARDYAGLSRRELAELIGISLRAVNYYENPDYARGRKSIVVRAWADACGRDFEEIWGVAGRELPRSGCVSRTPALATAS